RVDGLHVGRDDFQARPRAPAQLLSELSLRPGDRELLVVEQFANAQDDLEVLSAVDALPGAVLLRREHRELGLPVPQHVWLDADVLADFADLVEQLVGDEFRGFHAGSTYSRLLTRSASHVKGGRPGRGAIRAGSLRRSRGCARDAACAR